MKASSFFKKQRAYLNAQSGVAAIEFAFILPFLLFMYFGLLDLTGLISADRKMTSTANVVADLTGQNSQIVTKALIEDYMHVSELISNPLPPSGVSVRVYNYRNVAGTIELQWQSTKNDGPACAAPSTDGFQDLMTAGNDIIVAQACMLYEPFMATFLGKTVLGATSFTLQQDIVVRPRASAMLDCDDC